METPMTELPTQEQPPVFTLKRLLRRAWTILFKEPRGKGRVSRGELVVSSLLLGLLVTAITVPLSWISLVLSGIVGGIGSLWGFGYSFRRAHDLGKSKKYLLTPVIGFVVIMAIQIIWFGSSILSFMIKLSDTGPLSKGLFMGDPLVATTILGILGVLAAVFVIWYFVVLLILLFRKGTVGDNAYGSDSLLTQPKGNGLYWRAALLLGGVIFLVSIFENKPTEPDFGDFADYVDQQADMQADVEAQIEEQIQAAAEQAAPEQQPSE